MKKFPNRLTSLMESLEVSGYQLAREIGVSDMSISKYRSGKTFPSFEFFEKLVTRYPAVNLNWLIAKQGEMFLDPRMKPKAPKVKVHARDLLESKDDLIALQTKSLEMMEARLKELSIELKSHRNGRKPGKPKNGAGMGDTQK